jgi:hypothetical protein
MSFIIARNCWQGPHAMVCPQPVGADISPKTVDSRFDPNRSKAASKSRSATSPDLMLANPLSCRSMLWGNGCHSIN